MQVVSFVLVLAAGIALVAGLILDDLLYIWAAVIGSVLGLGMLWLARRREGQRSPSGIGGEDQSRGTSNAESEDEDDGRGTAGERDTDASADPDDESETGEDTSAESDVAADENV